MGWRILSEKLKQELFSLDDEIKTLFSTGKVLDGAFTIAINYMAYLLPKF
jgi:Zn-dependent oligopeptidase